MSAAAEREKFSAALLRNEDDADTRLAFADWLDERGEHEEAERHRRWPAAKKWIVDLCEKQRPTAEDREQWGENCYAYIMEIFLSYEDLMLLARDALACDEDNINRGHRLGFGVGGSESLCDDLRKHTEKFWRNWSIVTGIPVDPARVATASFTCAC